jgi:hypothetical protein
LYVRSRKRENDPLCGCPQATDALKTVSEMREALMLGEALARILQEKVLENERSLELQRSTRSDFERTLKELIGPPPEKDWKEEWDQLNIEYGLLMQVLDSGKGTQAAGNGVCGLLERYSGQYVEG